MLKRIKDIAQHFAKDSLYKNSIYLVMSTAVMSFFGFIFWVINARLFSSKDIGLATTTLSIATLISSLSLLGFNTSIVRFLPTSEVKERKINTVLTIIFFVTLIFSVLYLFLIDTLSPALAFYKNNIIYSFIFIVLIIATSINIIFESVFIAHRVSQHVFIKNLIFSLLKILIPIFLITWGVVGIISAISISILAAIFYSIFILTHYYKYNFQIYIDKRVVYKIYKFSFGSYLTTFIGGMPALLFPIIILNNLGPESSAYYYMVTMIIGLLYIIPIAVTQSLFAESSYNEKQLRLNFLKAIKIISLMLIPLAIFTLIFGKYILLFFGKEYSTEGVGFLQILILSTFLVSINYLFGIYFRIKQKLREINISVFFGAFVTLGLSILLLPLKLNGLGYSIVIGQLIVIIFYTFFFIKTRRFKYHR